MSEEIVIWILFLVGIIVLTVISLLIRAVSNLQKRVSKLEKHLRNFKI